MLSHLDNRNVKPVFCLYCDIDVHIAKSVHKQRKKINKIIRWFAKLSWTCEAAKSTYWRMYSSVHELLHWGTFRRAKAAACNFELKISQWRTETEVWFGFAFRNRSTMYLNNKIIYRYTFPAVSLLKWIQLTPKTAYKKIAMSSIHWQS